MRNARAFVLLMVGALGLVATASPAAADRGRGRTYHSHSRGHVVVRPSVGFYWGPSWGWWDPWWYSAAPGGYPVVYPNNNYGAYGALDTDVSPEKAEVWVDGKKVGLADDFDGFPSYLWLPKGTYDVVLYLPGYQTISRQYTIYPGLVVDVEDRLERGEATHPLELGPKTHERRDARLRADEERRLRAQESQRMPSGSESGWDQSEDSTWQQDSRQPVDARQEPGRLLLEVDPGDASVYLDGRFLGTGDDLARLRSGLLVDPGSHHLEVVRPGMRGSEESFEVESGREVSLSVELDEN